MAPTKGVEERHAPVRAVPQEPEGRRAKGIGAATRSGRPARFGPPAYSNFIFNTPGE